MTHVSCHFFVLKFGATLVYTFCYSTYLLTRSSVHSLCLPTALNVTLVKPELIPEFAGPSIACAEFSGPFAQPFDIRAQSNLNVSDRVPGIVCVHLNEHFLTLL